MKKRHGFIGFLKESIILTNLSKRINLLDKQLTELYLQLGLLTYNISVGISNDTESSAVIKDNITTLKQDITSLTKKAEERGLSRGKRVNPNTK